MRMAQPLNMGFNESIIVRGTDGLWLDTAELASGEGCLSFEVKGTNDANITIRCEPQLDASDVPDTMSVTATDGGDLGQACAVPTLPLTVVLGSHRNTKLKLCGGLDCHVLRHDLTQARLDPQQFKSFWINFTNGALSLGCGPRGCSCLLRQPVSIPASRLYIGFFSLDCTVAFRSITLSSPINNCAPSPTFQPPSKPLPLTDHCLNALAASITVDNVCRVLQVLEITWNAAHPLWGQCIALLAPHFAAIAVNSPEDITMLPVAALQHTLTCGHLCAPELLLFCVVESWALARELSPADCTLLASGGVPAIPRGCSDLADESADDSCSHCCPCNNQAGTQVRTCEHRDAVQLAIPAHHVAQCLKYIRFPLLSGAEIGRARGSPLWGLVNGTQHLLDELQDCTENANSGSIEMLAGSSSGASDRGSDGCQDTSPVHLRSNHAAVGCAATVAVPQGAEGAIHQAQSKVQGSCVVQQHELWRRWKQQRRRPANVSVELLLDYPGDQNGLVRYLGSNRGRRKHFLNPHLSGLMSVSSSSPFSTESDANKLLSQVFHSNLCAHSSMSSSAFWQLDFRPRELVCLQYVFGVNQSPGFPRSWRLQGSQDGSEWRDLHSVQNSQYYQRKGQFGAWNIQQPVLEFFSSIRLIMTGPAADGGSVLNVNYMELYGYVM